MSSTPSITLSSAQDATGVSAPTHCYPAPLTIINGDCRFALKTLPDESVNCCVTSPPYWGLRNYGHAEQIGQEETPQAFVETMCKVFAEVRRVLRKDGTCWLNLGDSYASAWSVPGGNGRPVGAGSLANGKRADRPNRLVGGLKEKDLVGIPWRVALALQAEGWYLRSDIIWAKANCMPESVTDRPTRSHEYLFLLTKSPRYYYDHEAIKEPCIYDIEKRIGQPNFDNKAEQCTGMRNKRDVWTVAPANYPDAHFATYPPALITPCILAGCPVGGLVLDPFGGSGTTGMVALELGRRAVLVELNPDYTKLINARCATTPGLPLAG